MNKPREWNVEHRVYVGNLGDNVSKEELEKVFGQYGVIESIYIGTAPPGFAFIEYKNPQSAEEAAKCLDSTRPLNEYPALKQRGRGHGIASRNYSASGFRGGARWHSPTRPPTNSDYRQYPKSGRGRSFQQKNTW